MAIYSIAISLLILYLILTPLISFLQNYLRARKTGLNLLLSPLTPYTWRWQFPATLLGSTLQRFPWFRAIDWTSAWADGATLHSQLGQNFILVSPGLNVLCTSDPMTIEHVLKNWRAYIKPANVNEILGTFGQNVDTSNGDDWVRHRKLTAPCFSERASAAVWSEAVKQADEVLQKWVKEEKTNSLIGDTSMLALNVVSAVAFENHQVNVRTEGHALSLREALVTVMSTAISPALEGIMPWLKASGLQMLLPEKVRGLLRAMGEFRQYMDETISRERERMAEKGETRGNLISTLIKANEVDKAEEKSVKARVSDVELRGNIFIFTVGGLESTAITLSYAMALLALHPEIQEWVAEEVKGVCGSEMPEYTKVFPSLKRVMAVMYETLRIYGPSPPLPRSHVSGNEPYTLPTTNHSPTLSDDTKPITLPGATQIMMNSWASQVSPLYFSSPQTWNPKRWLDASGKLLHPTSGSGFLVWGSGPRICPGMKFSQVEFTAVLASVLRKVRVELVVDEMAGRERRKEEEDKVMSVLKDSCADPLLLHVRRPEELWVRIVER